MQQAREWVRTAASIAVLTGAGISAESGVPTFRGAGGVWNKYRAEDLATPEAFARDPKFVWEWYDYRRGFLTEAKPNSGHLALAELERRIQNFTLITQNVDGLHQRAGSRNVLCVHGDIWTVRCTACGREERDLRVPLPALPPRCGCGAIVRPGVVWFGEALPRAVWERAVAAATEAQVFLVVGTSAVVYPAAGLALTAKSSGARVIEINTEETPFSAHVDCALRGPAGELLPLLIQ